MKTKTPPRSPHPRFRRGSPATQNSAAPVPLLVAAALLAAAGTGAALPAATEGEIGFLETFSLADDRAAALEQLVPGTPEHYYFTCLHLQNEGKLGEVDATLKAWLDRHKDKSDRYREIEHRQALLAFADDPDRTYEHLRDALKVRFDHRREDADAEAGLPASLDPDLYSHETLKAWAFQPQNNLNRFEDAALPWLAREDLDRARRRELLDRLRQPDVPGLAQLVAEDLAAEGSKGFGGHVVHGRLFKDQLDELLRLRPELIGNEAFAEVYLRRLAPAAALDWRTDAAAREAFLDRLWAFAERLPPAQNSLRAHVLFHRLGHDLGRGRPDRARFLAYLAIPRDRPYVNRERLREPARPADLGRNYGTATGLPPVGDDEPLVRAYLAHFLVAAEGYEAFLPHLKEDYLKGVFAEAKILAGAGDPERWYSLLDSPERYQALKDRVDIDFAPSNPEFFAATDPVALDLLTKNTPTLMVRIFEINAFNLYRESGREIAPNIDLDGLVANAERTETYEESPFRRVRRTFAFPEMARPGTYVVEFIGNGRSSRAVVRKGRLRLLGRTGAAGHVFRVLDGANKHLPAATIWLAGREFTPGAEGEIIVPFTENPGRQAVVLRHGDLATLAHFEHQREGYDLTAAFFVDREALVRGGTADVLVRPSFTVAGSRAPLAALDKVELTARSTDLDGVESTVNVPGFELFEDRESVFRFAVPDRLARVQFTLEASVEPLARPGEERLSAGATFTLNKIDTTDRVADLHLARTARGYELFVLGKTGEPRAGIPVSVSVKPRDYRRRVDAVLATDGQGRVHLGALPGVVHLRANVAGVGKRNWPIDGGRGRHSQPPALHGRAGEIIRVAYAGPEVAGRPSRGEVALYELRRGEPFRDRFDAVVVKDGFLYLQGLESGRYTLHLKGEGESLPVVVAEAAAAATNGFILGHDEHLEIVNPAPLQIESVAATRAGDGGKVTVRLRNAGADARVHLFASHFLPPYHPYEQLSPAHYPGVSSTLFRRPRTDYLEGRDIGDEYRYILERRLAKPFPGNLLRRPGLLLNPWALRSSQASTDAGGGGEAWGAGAMDNEASMSSLRAAKPRSKNRGATDESGWSSYDFLGFAKGAAAGRLINLRPAADGTVTVDRADLAGQHLHVVAVDGANTAYHSAALGGVPLDPVDLRLTRAFDPGVPLAERQVRSVVAAGKPFVVKDRSTAELEVYDSLEKVFGLFTTLSEDPRLGEFSFVLDWPGLDQAARRAKYSKFACHELNVFLARKDPAFFEAVVRPHIANKRDKTFIDDYLLGAGLGAHLTPWRHGRLNAAERAFLAERVPGRRAAAARHLGDLYDLLPPDPGRKQKLFATSLASGVLDLDGIAVVGGLHREYYKKSTKRLVDARGTNSLAQLEQVAAVEDLGFSIRGTVDKEVAARVDFDVYAGAKVEQRAQRLAEETAEAAAGSLNWAEPDDGRKTTFGRLESDLQRRASGRDHGFYRKLDPTRAWVENNYYQRPQAEQVAGLIPVNAFWRDFAARDPGEPFLSPHFPEASRNAAEMMLALAVLDLPFKAAPPAIEKEGDGLALTPAGHAVVFHRAVLPAGGEEHSPVLVSQQFFDPAEPTRQEGGRAVEHTLGAEDEFLVHRPYGLRAVLTNPTATAREVDVLLQVPAGALPLAGGRATRSHRLALPAHGTAKLETAFYFPLAGEAAHYPVQVSREGVRLAHAAPVTLRVVERYSGFDAGSWAHVSQQGTPAQVLAFLEKANVHGLDLAKVAWRLRDRAFFDRVTQLLAGRHRYDDTVWSYALFHRAAPAARDYLSHRDRFLARCGAVLDSPLVTVDPVERHRYEHVSYHPLVNPRAHTFGGHRKILNRDFHAQYHRLMKALSYVSPLTPDDRLEVATYLLLQDRVAEALGQFSRVGRGEVSAVMQYDYTDAYLAFSQGEPDRARALAEAYRHYPVDHWRGRFAEVIRQAEEIERAGRGKGRVALAAAGENGHGDGPGNGQGVGDGNGNGDGGANANGNGNGKPAEGNGARAEGGEPPRERRQTDLADASEAIGLEVEAGVAKLTYQNLGAARINLYLMDLELLFSRNPFVEAGSGRFTTIRPNHSEVVELPGGAGAADYPLPPRFRNTNVMVEVLGGGGRAARAYFANALDVQVSENYGQLKVAHQGTGRAVPKTYVKVYARLPDGSVHFYKDGYTDLRGRFDYSSLNPGPLGAAERFALLVLSVQHGASVLEVAAPVQ